MAPRLAVFLALVLAVASASNFASDPETHYANFLEKYQKSYPTAEEYEQRLVVFAHNLKLIDTMNAQHGSEVFGISKFSDLSPPEFRTLYLGRRPGAPNYDAAPLFEQTRQVSALPDAFDWRSKNAVSPVKNQGQCGSCWAFSVTEAIESQWFLNNHTLPILGPQQIVDCDTGRGDMGCNGGDTPTAYEYVISAGGMDSESAYPYTGSNDQCAFKPADVQAKIDSWHYITKTKNETEMQVGLFNEGPLSICVDATTWQFYAGGVITSMCGDALDHCVMITGFGSETDVFGYHIDYWTVRNSWGADWGDDGYIYVERNKNLCGIAVEVTLPQASS